MRAAWHDRSRQVSKLPPCGYVVAPHDANVYRPISSHPSPSVMGASFLLICFAVEAKIGKAPGCSATMFLRVCRPMPACTQEATTLMEQTRFAAPPGGYVVAPHDANVYRPISSHPSPSVMGASFLLICFAVEAKIGKAPGCSATMFLRVCRPMPACTQEATTLMEQTRFAAPPGGCAGPSRRSHMQFFVAATGVRHVVWSSADLAQPIPWRGGLTCEHHAKASCAKRLEGACHFGLLLAGPLGFCLHGAMPCMT